MRCRRSKSAIRAGLVAGLVAGLAASFAMNLAMRLGAIVSEASDPFESEAAREDRLAKRIRHFQELGDPNQEILSRASLRLFRHEIPTVQLQKTATAVHYVFGTALGCAYTAVADLFPAISSGTGLGFGLGWWGAVNEVLLPKSGLLPPVKNIPKQMHAAMLVSHVVYGISLEQVRRSVRGMLRA